MKQKARLNAIQKAAQNKAMKGQPITEILVYCTDENGETRLLETMQCNTFYKPDNRRENKDYQKSN